MSSKSLRGSRVLDVPFRKQILANSCFPACVRMVLKFYGDDIDEKWLCKNSTLPGHKGCWDVKIGPILIRKGYSVTSFWDGSIQDWNSDSELIKAHQKEYKRAAKQGLKHKKNATISLIKKFIDNNTPVLTEVSSDRLYREHFGYTHMVVIVGYDNKNFYFHDPDKTHGGKNKKVSFGRFRKCWEKISSDSGRSMIVIEKSRFKRLEDIIDKYKN